MRKLTRDSQRSKVYRWERAIVDGRTLKVNRDSAATLLVRVWSDFGRSPDRTPTIVSNNRGGGGWARRTSFGGYQIKLSFPCEVGLILHEAVHCLLFDLLGSTYKEHPGHGPLFARLAADAYIKYAGLDRAEVHAAAARVGVDIASSRETYVERKFPDAKLFGCETYIDVIYSKKGGKKGAEMEVKNELEAASEDRYVTIGERVEAITRILAAAPRFEKIMSGINRRGRRLLLVEVSKAMYGRPPRRERPKPWRNLETDPCQMGDSVRVWRTAKGNATDLDARFVCVSTHADRGYAMVLCGGESFRARVCR